MATKTKVSKATKAVLQSSAKSMDIDIRFIKGNEEQSRGNGVCENLEAIGVGVLTRIKEDVPCLMELLLSEKAEDWAKGCELLEKNEPDLVETAASLTMNGQLHNIGVRLLSTEECEALGVPEGSWNVIYGMRRTIAKAYNFAKSAGVVPPTLRAVQVDWHENATDTFFMSIAENTTRKNETPVDQAKYFKKLRKQGMNMKDIAKATGEEYQTVRNRLAILDLPQEVQDKIHAGKASWTREVKKYMDAQTTEAPKTEEAAVKPVEAPSNADRKRMPTLNQAKDHYVLLDKPADMSDEEWTILSDEGARKYMAYYGGYPYQSRKDLKKKKADDERAALQAEQARKAAEEAEQTEAAAK